MDIQIQLVSIIASEIKPLLHQAMTECCCGCQHQHPSQKQHQCIMLEDREAWIYFCLDRALDLLNWKKIGNDFRRRLTLDRIIHCSQHLNEYKRLSDDHNRLEESCRKDRMKEKLVWTMLLQDDDITSPPS